MRDPVDLIQNFVFPSVEETTSRGSYATTSSRAC